MAAFHTDSSLPDQTKGSHLSSNAGFVISQPEVCLLYASACDSNARAN
jgi:hypothetical protein